MQGMTILDRLMQKTMKRPPINRLPASSPHTPAPHPAQAYPAASVLAAQKHRSMPQAPPERAEFVDQFLAQCGFPDRHSPDRNLSLPELHLVAQIAQRHRLAQQHQQAMERARQARMPPIHSGYGPPYFDATPEPESTILGLALTCMREAWTPQFVAIAVLLSCLNGVLVYALLIWLGIGSAVP